MPIRRLDLRQAAEALGTSVDAVRKRIQRGTLDSEKVDGKVYVWLDTNLDAPGAAVLEAKDETISELRDRVGFLERELERKDAILLNMTEAMKALSPPAPEEPPSEAPGAPSEATEQPGRVEPQLSVEAADEAERAGRAPSESAMGGGRLHRSWWRRVFGS
jgi:hypothetical protein